MSRLRVAEKVSGLRVAEISAGAISLYEGILLLINYLKLIENIQLFEKINIFLQYFDKMIPSKHEMLS